MAFFGMLWPQAVGFAKKIPGWVYWIILAVFVGEFINLRARADQEERDKARQKLSQARADAKIQTTVTTIQETRSHDAQRADEAVRNMPAVHSLDELRHTDPAVADELFGPADR